jgi:hypothetical protein
MGFNQHQIEEIRYAINNSPEHFTPTQIEEYIKKLNEISQLHWSQFDDFWGNMMQHLEGLEDCTFKQWIDSVYEEHKKKVETDDEYDSDSDE